jgi:hypothetical protein
MVEQKHCLLLWQGWCSLSFLFATLIAHRAFVFHYEKWCHIELKRHIGSKVDKELQQTSQVS